MTVFIYHEGTETLLLASECAFVTDKEFLEDDEVKEGEDFETYLKTNPGEYEAIPVGVIINYAGTGALFEEAVKNAEE